MTAYDRRSPSVLRHALPFVLPLTLLLGCAQVPRESVELSTTVGRDISVAHDAHRATAEILFGRMKQDVERFVDEVYAAHQIRTMLQDAQNLADAGDSLSIISGLRAASRPGASDQDQLDALALMGVFVELLQKDIDGYKAELLAPIQKQERETLAAIDRSYAQIHYANSIVTGHLASVVQVHDAQESLLNEIGIEDLRARSGTAIAAASVRIDDFVAKAAKADEKIDVDKFSEAVEAAFHKQD